MLSLCYKQAQLRIPVLIQVHADIATDDSGQSRGYGTVRFESKADAASAIEARVANSLATLPVIGPLGHDCTNGWGSGFA